jgi:phosphoenolpyruvate phosphomutase
MRRAEAYLAAGSDGILIHSALSSATEVLAFQKEWAGRSPVVIVPTKYHATPTDVFREAGFSRAIWANQLLRAAVVAMQETARTIYQDQNLRSVEDRIAPVKELFRLQGASELQEAEERYRRSARPSRARSCGIAGFGAGELPNTAQDHGEDPCRPLLASSRPTICASRINGARLFVGGDRPAGDQLRRQCHYDSSERFAACGLRSDDSIPLCVPARIKRYILDALAETDDDFAIVVDTEWHESVNRGRAADYVSCTKPHSRRAFYQQTFLERAAEDLPESSINGEWMGFMKISAAALPRFRSQIAGACGDRQTKLQASCSPMVRSERVRDLHHRHWLDIDSLKTVAAGSLHDRGRQFASPPPGAGSVSTAVCPVHTSRLSSITRSVQTSCAMSPRRMKAMP